jgi:hypothetical protein
MRWFENLFSFSSIFSLLSQYQFCLAGVGLGTAYALHSKGKGVAGLLPMVVGGAVGSLSDLVYGYTVACVPQRDRYHGINNNSTPSEKESLNSKS